MDGFFFYLANESGNNTSFMRNFRFGYANLLNVCYIWHLLGYLGFWQGSYAHTYAYICLFPEIGVR